MSYFQKTEQNVGATEYEAEKETKITLNSVTAINAKFVHKKLIWFCWEKKRDENRTERVYFVVGKKLRWYRWLVLDVGVYVGYGTRLPI